MQIHYKYSEDDFVRAGTLMAKKRSPIIFVMRWIGTAVLLWAAYNLVFKPDMRTAELTPANAPRLLGALALNLLLAALPSITKHGLKKQFRNSPLLSEARTMIFDHSGYQLDSDSSHAQLRWSTYVASYEDKSNFLLVQQGKRIFVPIPKRQLTLDQIEELRGLLRQHVGKG